MSYPEIPREIDIPKEFYSIDAEGLFEACCMCEKKLLDDFEPYLIERAFKRVNSSFENVLFEYAICFRCAEKMNQAMSKESMQKIEAHYRSYFSTRFTQKETDEDPDDMAWYNQCMVKETPRSELSEYNICGLFRGNKMMIGEFPYLLSMDAMEEVVELLSKQTKDELDNFKRDFLGGPPELEELLKGRPVMVI